MKFLLDTNFLLIPAQFHVDVFSELSHFGKPELYTLTLVVKELDKLSRSRGRKAAHARIALLLLKKEGVRILGSPSQTTDAGIVNAARKGFVVCTQDRALIKRLRTEKIPVVTLRQKRYLIKK